MRHLLIPLLFLPAAALAEGCPVAPDHRAEVDALIAEAQAAPTEMAGREVGNRMWLLWTDAPDEPAQSLLDEGMQKLRGADYLGALDDLNRLIEYCPDYAEGYNQRAFAYYLMQRFAPALEDLDRAIDLSPNHVAALSGRALTLMGLGRTDEAARALARALELNPWLSERSLAAPGGPLAPKGKDI